MHLQAGALLKNGEYKIEKVLGQGGFGITYLAEQTSLGRKVALKEFFMEGLCNRDAATSHVSVPSVGSKKLVERFKQKFIKEARMIASFDNNHIISIYDVFEENGTAYYVMEYLGGKSLSAIVNEQGIMSETLALKYIRQVADALAEVHANNLLHLDVKPANIMLNKKGEAVLIDFGISKHYDEAGNQTSSALIGTSEGYAPLEQYEASALDSFTPATDIYALGATLFFLLTGTRPPKAGDVMNDGLPELPSEISQTVSGAITAAMQPRRKDRPQSIAEFLCLVESGKMQDESDGETVLNGNVKGASKREGENLFTHTASESSFDEVKGENGKLVADEFHSIDVVEVPDSADDNVILSVSEESHSASPVISNESEKSNSAGIEILPPFSRQNDKDGNEEVERRNEKERSVGVVISNESEKSQKNKPKKSLWLILLLLLLIAVAGAWFLFNGTGNGDAPKTDTVKKDTPTSPKGEEKEKPVEKGDSLHALQNNIDVSDERVNQIQALVIPSSTKIVRGGNFQAQIILAAVDSTQRPQIFIGEEQLTSENGEYSVQCNKSGNYTMDGYMLVNDGSGSLSRYDFKQSYTVVDPTATVSASMMNVFYAGYSNPVSISVPGVPGNKISATLKGRGSIKSDGKGGYIVVPTRVGEEVVIVVTALNDAGKSQDMGEYSFRVRQLPDPTPFIEYKDKDGNTQRYRGGKGLSKQALMRSNGIVAAIDDGLLNIGFKVLSFETVFYDNMGNAMPLQSEGANFSARQKGMMRDLSRGKRFYISHVKVVGPDGVERLLPTTLEVIMN